MERAIPILPVDDLREAREFYVDKLGFTPTFENSDDGRTGLLGKGCTRRVSRPVRGK